MARNYLWKAGLVIAGWLATGASVQGQNLVPNSDMESYVCCPTATFQYNCIATWTNPNTASPEYFNACGSGGGDVPSNSAGNQNAHSGNGYVGMIIGWSASDYREYCQIQLSSVLTAGQTYSVSYWVSLADGSQYSTNRFEAYLSPTLVNNGSTNVLPFVPQVAPSTGFLGDKTNWTQVCGTFTAAGGERYLIVGNFKNSGSTTLTFVSAGLPFCQSGGYYYVDDVALSPGSVGCIILPVTLNDFTAKVQDDNSVRLDWNVGPENDVDRYLVERSSMTEAYHAIAEIPARNNQDGGQSYEFVDTDQLTGTVYYRLTTVDRNGEMASSQAVGVNLDGDFEDAGIKSFFPSPARMGESVNIDYLLYNADAVQTEVHDQAGRLIQAQENDLVEGMNRFTIETKDLKPGTYIVTVKSSKGTSHKRLIVKH